MRARTKRLWVIGVAGIFLAGASALALAAIQSNAMFYRTPSDIVSQGGVPSGETFRLGGMVEIGSIVFGDGAEIRFTVTDGLETMPVRYEGIVPDLFREGEGVIADGAFADDGSGVFVATRILAKHDENYVPRELRDLDMEKSSSATGYGN